MINNKKGSRTNGPERKGEGRENKKKEKDLHRPRQ